MIAIGCDHGGFELKNVIVDYLKSEGYDFIDLGTYDTNSIDYPDIAHKVCTSVTNGDAKLGIIVCGTGIGMNMAANKHKGIRAAQCSDTFSAKMTRQHNDANVLSLPARFIPQELAMDIVKTYLTTDFEGGRHQTRVDLVMAIENE